MEQPTFETKLIKLWNLREEFRSAINFRTQTKLEPAEISVEYSGEGGRWGVSAYPSVLMVADNRVFAFTRVSSNKSLDAAIEDAIKETEKELLMIQEGKVKSI